jgi:hypothetical protein
MWWLRWRPAGSRLRLVSPMTLPVGTRAGLAERGKPVSRIGKPPLMRSVLHDTVAVDRPAPPWAAPNSIAAYLIPAEAHEAAVPLTTSTSTRGGNHFRASALPQEATIDLKLLRRAVIIQQGHGHETAALSNYLRKPLLTVLTWWGGVSQTRLWDGHLAWSSTDSINRLGQMIRPDYRTLQLAHEV